MISDFLKYKLGQRRKFLLGGISSIQALDTYYVIHKELLSDIEMSALAEIKEINNIIGKPKGYKYKIIK